MMRVIAGKVGGRKLTAPKGPQTRPTPDRVKEALFSMLGPELSDAQVLDLFAGSGALGIEALSRGARAATFVEQARPALMALRGNLSALGLQASGDVLPQPVAQALQTLGTRGRAFRLIFLDPPYALDLVTKTLMDIARWGLLAPGGTIVAEHSGKNPAPLAPQHFVCHSTRRYGDVALSLYSHAPPNEAP